MSCVVTINVVDVNGAQSFSPNPATLPAGQMVEWHNVDNITHRVVFVLFNPDSVVSGVGTGVPGKGREVTKNGGSVPPSVPEPVSPMRAAMNGSA